MEQLQQKYPLSLPQQDIYYEQLLYPDEPIYNIGARVEIQGPLDVSILQEAYRQLINQHESYRMIIGTDLDIPVFTIAEGHNTSIQLVDLSAAADAVQAAGLLMDQNFRIPFDLEAGRLLHRFMLIKISPTFHYLFSVYHHIITDGWGTSLMFQRFVKNYNELITTGEIRTTYPFPYTSFVLEDQQYVASDAYQEDKKYWLSAFSSLPESFIPLKEARKNKSRQQELFIPRSIFNQLISLAGELKVSTFHIILGVIYTYFARYYNNSDITVGLPVLNRGKAVYKKTVGLFMGVSPLRIQVDFDADFRSLVNKIRDELKINYRHQRFPLGKLIQALQVFGEKDRLFNITLSYEKQDYSDHFEGTVTTVRPMSHGAERVALALYVREFDDHEDVRLDFSYNLSYFTDDDIFRLTRYFNVIIQAVIATPGAAIRDIDYMPAQERQDVLHTFNQYAAEYPSYSTVIDLFSQQVKLSGEKTAVIDAGKRWSYAALETSMLKVAAGIGGDDIIDRRPVAVLMYRSADLVAALLGVMRTGRPYIPLDPDFPVERLEYIVRHSGCECMLLDRALQGYLSLPEVTTYIVEDLLSATIEEKQLVSPTPADSAYIIYTSGSTGNPKGVEIGHQALTNFLWSMKEKPGITAKDLFFAVTTCSFDISILELFLPLIAGATVYIASRQQLRDPAALISTLEQVRPTMIQATPSFYQLLFNAGWTGQSALKVLCGGDLLSEALAERLLNSCAALWNMYGPTETTIWSAVKRIVHPAEAGNIGTPINNTGIYILDRWRKPVAIGATGDIYISGHGLAKGYYKDPVQTAEKFLNGEPMLYFTGDTGKWIATGEIAFGGRSDAQVKIRGYRIETGEIEKKLVESGQVSQAVVIARKTAEAAFLVAYVKPLGNFNAEALIAVLQQRLPEYMVPAVIIPVDTFPLTPNNKIDRKTLAAREINLEGGVRYIAPGNETEEQLVRIWSKYLQVKGIGANDHFFRLGGHSLSAVRVIYEINTFFSCKLSPRDIFECPTIAALAQRVASAEKILYQPIPSAPERDSYPLTQAQQHIWIQSQRSEGSIAYNMNAAYEISGQLELPILEKAVTFIIAQHESLRTAFVEIAGVPRQVILPADERTFHIPVVENATGEVISSLLHQEFNLAAGSLLRMVLAVTRKGRQVLLFSTHHIVMDGWSLEVFIRTLSDVYNHLQSSGRPPELTKPARFRDYAEWITNRLPDATAAMFWKEQLQGRPAKGLFSDPTRHADTGFSGNQCTFLLDDKEKTALTEMAAKLDVTLYSLLISLTGIFLWRYTGQEDFYIGTVTAGREQPELSDAIGMYALTIPLRMQVQRDRIVAQQVGDVHRHILEAGRHRPDEASAALFDVMIAYQDPDATLTDIRTFNGFRMQPFAYQHLSSRFAYTFNFYHVAETLVCDVEYNTSVSTDTVAGKVATELKQYLQQGLALINARVDAVVNTPEPAPDAASYFPIDFNF
ncbi:non-ribosomal peptide synthetase [Chitinophaga rhizophila]|uniref:Amino acid adenylation domain-containing protein n=1 Tax=Chitinophaga rhizophila TaxID=2866212 RepID=A0ABS7G8K3_9BACT|nr:non-ribosomal peptide synthetase [Chitinophaga rhizophila]MBW8683027.1 amino acid adenylation domain-containing protein [Chitinophaga rhizophila]